MQEFNLYDSAMNTVTWQCVTFTKVDYRVLTHYALHDERIGPFKNC